MVGKQNLENKINGVASVQSRSLESIKTKRESGQQVIRDGQTLCELCKKQVKLIIFGKESLKGESKGFRGSSRALDISSRTKLHPYDPGVTVDYAEGK